MEDREGGLSFAPPAVGVTVADRIPEWALKLRLRNWLIRLPSDGDGVAGDDVAGPADVDVSNAGEDWAASSFLLSIFMKPERRVAGDAESGEVEEGELLLLPRALSSSNGMPSEWVYLREVRARCSFSLSCHLNRCSDTLSWSSFDSSPLPPPPTPPPLPFSSPSSSPPTLSFSESSEALVKPVASFSLSLFNSDESRSSLSSDSKCFFFPFPFPSLSSSRS